MVVHSALPPLLEAAVAEELGAAHVAHGEHDGPDVRMALPFAPRDGVPFDHWVYGADASWVLRPDRSL
jgi:hypothetical protein